MAVQGNLEDLVVFVRKEVLVVLVVLVVLDQTEAPVGLNQKEVLEVP